MAEKTNDARPPALTAQLCDHEIEKVKDGCTEQLPDGCPVTQTRLVPRNDLVQVVTECGHCGRRRCADTDPTNA